MAGFSKLYVIGEEGGVHGADGVNPIYLQVLVGDADRQWLEAHYFDKTITPLGSIEIVIPERPDDPMALLDACIVFFPSHFVKCPSLAKIAAQLVGMTALDFNLGKASIPTEWMQLRREAWRYFQKLVIFEAMLKRFAMPAERPA